MGWKKYDTSREDEINRQRIERMQQYINSLNKPYIFKDLPEAYNPVDPDQPQLGNVQARAGIDQGKSNTYTVQHTDGTQSRVWPAINTIPLNSGVHCAGGQHQSPQAPSTLDRMLRVGRAIGVIL
jgi:hypothetical protein